MSARRCPSPGELERAFFGGGDAPDEHLAGCARCRGAWAEIEALAGLARSLPAPESSGTSQDSLRTALTCGPLPASGPRPRRAIAAGLTAAGIVAGAAVVMWSTAPLAPLEVAATHRGQIRALEPTARHWVTRAQPDEIIRLVDGAISLDVEHLEAGERFRVVTGDAEVEVRGTTFEVVARADRLELVRVVRGSVEVRIDGRRVALLEAGERWGAPARVEASAPSAIAVPSTPASPPPEPRPASPRQASAPQARASMASPRQVSPRQASPRQASPSPASTPPAHPDREAFEAGWSALEAGNLDGAVDAFERVLAVSQDPALREDARYFLGVSQARSGNHRAARTTFEVFLARYPDSARFAEAAAMAGWLYYDAGDEDRAEQLFERATKSVGNRGRKSGRDGLEAIRRDRARR